MADNPFSLGAIANVTDLLLRLAERTGGGLEDLLAIREFTLGLGQVRSGQAGPRGERGLQGVAGLPGAQGMPGLTGPRGDTGLMGLAGLAGAAGKTGERGARGEQGLQGIAGLQGVPGARGIAGIQGSQGDPGIAGIAGLTGPAGRSGPQGAIGPSGPQGLEGPLGGVTSIADWSGIPSFPGGVTPAINTLNIADWSGIPSFTPGGVAHTGIGVFDPTVDAHGRKILPGAGLVSGFEGGETVVDQMGNIVHYPQIPPAVPPIWTPTREITGEIPELPAQTAGRRAAEAIFGKPGATARTRAPVVPIPLSSIKLPARCFPPPKCGCRRK